MRNDTCSVAECPKAPSNKGLCGMHAMRLKRRGTTDEPPPRRSRPECSLELCSRPHAARGLCMPHYRRLVANGDPGPAEIKTYDKAATRYVSPEGYVRVKMAHPRASRGWVLEHIPVMESLLGRPLLPGEEVHHINGQRGDNRPENLELWVVRQPKGQRPEDLVEWAREILILYGGENAGRPHPGLQPAP